MTTAVKPTYTQTLYLVSWSQPDKEGCIDFFDDDNEGRVWETLEDAEASLAQEGPPGAYIVKVTYQRLKERRTP